MDYSFFNLSTKVVCTFFMSCIFLANSAEVPVHNDVTKEEHYDHNEIVYDEIIQQAKKHREDSSNENIPLRKQFLKDKAISNAEQAFMYRNYIDPDERLLMEEKKLFNLDSARMSEKKNSEVVSSSMNSESSLMSSFSGDKMKKKKSFKFFNREEKKKDYKQEVLKMREEEEEKLREKDSSAYKSQAESFSSSFSK